MERKYAYLIFSLVILSLISLAACNSNKVEVTVYFIDTNRFAASELPFEVGVTREALASQFLPEVVLEEYFLGPTPEEQAQGLAAWMNGVTGFSSLVVKDGIARVYLEGPCNSQGATYTIAGPLYVNLKQFDFIDYVKIYDSDGYTTWPDGQKNSIPGCLEP